MLHRDAKKVRLAGGFVRVCEGKSLCRGPGAGAGQVPGPGRLRQGARGRPGQGGTGVHVTSDLAGRCEDFGFQPEGSGSPKMRFGTEE